MEMNFIERQNKGMAFAFAFLLSIALLGMFSTTAFASVNPKIQMQNYSISEIPANPGDVINLTLVFKSLEWDNCADTVSVQIATQYPLSVQGSDTQYVDQLCLNDSPEKGTFTFQIPVDTLAQTGTYQISVVTNYEKRFSKFTEANTVNLRVGQSPYFAASVTSSNPVDIYPGDSGAVTITFQNLGGSLVESSRVAFSATDGLEVKWAGQQQELGQIIARGSAAAVFNIEAAKNLTPGIYHITARLDYTGEDQLNGSKDFAFSVPIKQKAEFAIIPQQGTTVVTDTDQIVQLSVKNTGTLEARKVKLQVKPIFPFSTDGTVRYIDSLMPGEEKNITYLLHIDKDGTAGEQITGMFIQFEDPQGKQFTDSEDFALKVRQKTLQETAIDYWYVGVLILVILVLKFKPKKKQ